MAGTETPLDGGNMNNGVVRVGDTVRRPAGPWTPSPGAQWQVLIPADGNEIIAHHDLAPQPLVIGDSEWAFIDWDTAGPGTRLWDLAYAMHGFAPLTANPALQRDDASHRLRVIADAYDLTQQQRLDIIPLLPAAPRRCTTSSPGKQRRAPSPGHGYGTRATATPGGLTPATSPTTNTSGARPSSDSADPAVNHWPGTGTCGTVPLCTCPALTRMVS